MNLGIESETLEFKKTTGEIDKAVCNIASMLNKHGHGSLYFGVSPNGEVTGQQISASSLDDVAKKIKDAIRPVIYPEIIQDNLDGKTVIRVEFSGSEKPYSAYGRYYKRVHDRTEEMTPDELKQMMASTDYSSYWENNLTVFGVDAIDHSALEEFYRKAVSCGRIEPLASYDEKELLYGLGLMENDRLTNAGFYLFSNRKPVVLKLAVYVTDERINFSDIARYEDNIFNLIKKSFSYVKEHIRWKVSLGDGTSRVETPEIPVEALREIIVNSFAHADYRGITENEIDITPTQIEIYNPGEFPTNLTPEMFVENRIKSMPRNKLILNTLYKSKDVEIFGSGFKKVYFYCSKMDRKVSYNSENGGFSFVFYRDIDGDINSDISSDKEKTDVTKKNVIKMKTEDMVIRLLNEDSTYSRSQLAEYTGKTVRTIQRALDTLSEDGRIKRIGSRKTGYWEII